jgi:beta-galactosidase
LKQSALALVSRGAALVEYWHWHTLHFGAETYWGGVLPHSQRPGRVYREVAEIGALLGTLGGLLDDYVPDSDVAMVYSQESNWALEFSPPLTDASGMPDRQSYTTIFDAFYRGIVDAGAQVRILHMAQLVAIGAAEVARRHPVLVAPALYVATDAELEFLRDYALAGGHLVAGIRTAYADAQARARVAVAPPVLSAAAGVRYEEFSNLETPLRVTGTPRLPLSASAAGWGWADGLIPDGAEALATYEHPELGRFPAVTSAAAGAGRITYVGTVPNPVLARDLARSVVPHPVAEEWLTEVTASVRISSGTIPDGRRVWFLFNWSSEAGTAIPPVSLRDAVSGQVEAAGLPLTLGAWDCRVLLQSDHRSLIADEAVPREGQ